LLTCLTNYTNDRSTCRKLLQWFWLFVKFVTQVSSFLLLLQ
jgi:hypothetical protein